MTGDDHAASAARPALRPLHVAQPAPAAPSPNWECVRARPTSIRLAAHERAGRRVRRAGLRGRAPRQPVGCPSNRLTPGAARRASSTRSWRPSQAKYTSVPAPVTEPHALRRWSDWATQPKVELARGIRLDTNYYHYPESWIGAKPGFMTGSAASRCASPTSTARDRRLSGAHAHDRRGRPGLPVHGRRAARQGARAGGLLRRLRRQHAYGLSAPHAGADAIVAAAQARGVPIDHRRSSCSPGRTAATRRRSAA